MVAWAENSAAQTAGVAQYFFPSVERFVSPDMWNLPYNSPPNGYIATPPSVGQRRAIVKSDVQQGHNSGQITNNHMAQQPFSGHSRLPFWDYRPALPHSQQNYNNSNFTHNHQKWASSPVVGSGRLAPERQQQITPPPGLEFRQPLIDQNKNTHGVEDQVLHSQQSPPSINDIASELGNIQLSPISSPPASVSPWSTAAVENDDDASDSDDESPSHPNKYPVEIEYHDNKFCSYKRQAARSGEKIKQKLVTSYDPITLEPQTSLQQSKHYQKHLVRICRCGKYQVMDGALQQGRSNDCNGYEIHYSQKCRWKAYDDYKTGKRVLIRLCKCYKPSA